MTARSDARAADVIYRTPADPLQVGDQVQTSCGVGVIEFVAYSAALESPLYTVAIDTRTKLRLLARDITLLRRAA
jgi:hypothetical protein